MRYTITLIGASLALPAYADAPRIMTDTPVVHALVAQVMGDRGTPDLLLDRGGDPHSFQLRPSKAQALAQADALFWIGAELTPWLERAIDGVGVSGTVVTLIDVPGLHLMEYAFGHDHDHDDHGHDDHGHAHEEEHNHGHDDHGHAHEEEHGHGHDDHGHAHEEEHGHGHDDHGHAHEEAHDHGDDDHGHAHEEEHGHGHAHEDGHSNDGLDPHAWMNTGNAELWLDAIAAHLSEVDPDHAETYAKNAASARDEIAALAAEVAEILAPVGAAPLVVFHDAYGYFADQFGLNIAGTIALGDAAAPGAQRLSELRGQLADVGAACIFPEVNHSSRYVDVVVEGTDVRIGGELDPAGVLLEPGPGLYGTLMRQLAQQISDCMTDET